jgi:hypothetical protein
MNERVRAIVEEARKLTPQERVELRDLVEAAVIEDDMNGTPNAIQTVWLQEVERRIAQAQRDGTEFVDSENVVTRLRQLLR